MTRRKRDKTITMIDKTLHRNNGNNKITELRTILYKGNNKITELRTILQISVITKLPNSEQSYKVKVKTHMYINRKNQSITGKL